MSIMEIGCCGAYCKTCKAFVDKTCKGCKVGYEKGERDIAKAKCKIKVCCMNKKFQSCADCPEYKICTVINDLYNKKGHKYGKYRQATVFIKENGYDAFLKIADMWTNAYGKY